MEAGMLHPRLEMSGHRLALVREAELAAGREAACVSSATFAVLLDRVRDALILAAADGQVVHLNAAAEQQLARAGPLRFREGRLWCGKRACGTALRQALAAACDSELPNATTMLLSDHKHGRLIVGISPLGPREGPGLALIAIHEECMPRRRSVEPLKSLFNLTRAEAEIALRIAEGATPTEIGRERRVALNTVRGQMKSLAAKLGCTRQVEIVTLVRAIPAPASGHEAGKAFSLTI